MRQSSVLKILLLQLVCVLALSELFWTASAQAQYKKKEEQEDTADGDDEDEDETGEFMELTKDNFEDKVVKAGSSRKFFIVFQEPDDRKVRHAIPDFAQLAEYTMGEPQVARVFCHKAPIYCKRMQALHTLDLPQVRLIEGNNVYKYPGEYTYEAMKKFLDEGLYREEQADELKLSNAFERYLKEGDTRPIPKKDISDKDIPLSVMDFSGFGFSDRVGK